MNPGVLEITVPGLLLAFIPVAVVLLVLYRWSAGAGTATYALGRMLLQLILIGYVLNFLFAAEQVWLVASVLAVMLIAASSIAVRPVQQRDTGTYGRAFAAIFVGGVPVLWLVTQQVVQIEPWYEPRYVIPLAGMIFASAMNCVSLAAERFASEKLRGTDPRTALHEGFQAALIPLINSLFAVGLVSLPGMMTGQILSGIDPLIAARYQIVVMAMLFGSSGIAAACYLWLASRLTQAS
ncbi:MAG: ABC transporter permease [Gammaproteobacteria bacterium]